MNIVQVDPNAVDQRPHPKHGGFIYIVEYSDGTVKVGQTVNPASRLANHSTGGRSFGLEINRAWLSVPHPQYRSNERALIAWGSANATSRGREYFHGASADRVVDFARTLDYSQLSAAEVARRDAAAEANWAALSSSLRRPPFTTGVGCADWLEAELTRIVTTLGMYRTDVDVPPDDAETAIALRHLADACKPTDWPGVVGALVRATVDNIELKARHPHLAE